MSRRLGDGYEQLVCEQLNELGLVLLAKNVYVEGGEIDLLMQASSAIIPHVEVGEICIVEVKGRQSISEWNETVVSATKKRRWQSSALQVIWMIEDREIVAKQPITGYQMVLVRVEGSAVDIQWNVCDVEMF